MITDDRAVWTRFQPIAYEVQKVIHSGQLGKVNAFFADNCVNIHPDSTFSYTLVVQPRSQTREAS